MSLSPDADMYVNSSEPRGGEIRQPVAMKWLAQFVSTALHPLFINGYVVYYLVFFQQGYFDGIGERSKWLIVIQVAGRL